MPPDEPYGSGRTSLFYNVGGVRTYASDAMDMQATQWLKQKNRSGVDS